MNRAAAPMDAAQVVDVWGYTDGHLWRAVALMLVSIAAGYALLALQLLLG